MLIQNKVIGTVGVMGGIPFLHTEFAWSLLQMAEYNHDYLLQPGEHVHYEKATVSFHPLARNDLVAKMLGDWLLQLDTDHLFEPDLLVRLLVHMEHFQCDVLTGVYCHRGAPHPPVLYNWYDGNKIRHIIDWDRSVKGFEIGSAGGGVLLVKRKVFERIRDELGDEPFSIVEHMGEDHSFFWRLKLLGMKPYCASRIQSYHLATTPIMLSDVQTESIPLEISPMVEGKA